MLTKLNLYFEIGISGKPTANSMQAIAAGSVLIWKFVFLL
jgi:hypothetical protein